ncbi:helix-turn-helix domain-containing protein [Phytohabitans rumicis]|uniref:Transcriptional regulator n=1 Tax=Phytohabitans rumicis TaxID=1076125 RepID=A0A6V8LHV7_9ACTN|nr:helix-turn-helix transcriptional regulator [Phytohabitans rumicis]GFJ92235.1 transcriptional regulator [Phytohabitans rumicis]
MPTKREQFAQTIRAQYLGERMRQLREERGLVLKYIAAYLSVEFSTLARYERAEWPFRKEHVSALLDVYGVHDEDEREELISLARDAWRLDQWEKDDAPGKAPTATRQVIDPWWVQSRAEELCVYATVLIPELLRTRDYAEVVIQHSLGAQPSMAKVDTLVRQHLNRQAILDNKPPTRLTAIFDEAVLYRPVGSRAILQAQLEHLARAVERPHVNVRVLPTRIGLHDGVDGAFTVCRMHGPYPTVAVLTHLGGRMVIEGGTADRYETAFGELGKASLSPTDSMDLIEQTARQLGAGAQLPAGREVAA